VIIGPLVLPPANDAAAPASKGLDGRWTRTPDEPLATTLELSGPSYTLGGALEFESAGSATVSGDELMLADDPACPGVVARYAFELGSVDRFGLLPENQAQTMSLTVLTDECAARADALSAETWTLRGSGREGIYGICDPPNEEAAITGHWPEPSGCS
jgi:hypothetical protein